MRTEAPRTFEQFAIDELPGMLSFAAVLTGSHEAAADAVQESMIRAALRWTRIGAMEHPAAYVRRMITNEWLGQRRRWFARHVELAADLDPLTEPQHDFSDTSDLRDDVRARLQALPPRQRAVLVLRHYLALSDDEIAAELGCATGTVRSLASRGAAALRVSLHLDDAGSGSPPAPDHRSRTALLPLPPTTRLFEENS